MVWKDEKIGHSLKNPLSNELWTRWLYKVKEKKEKI